MWVSCLEVLKQEEILNAVKKRRGSQFRGHKAQTKVKPMHFPGKNVRKKLRLMNLDAEEQEANNN